MAAKQTHDCEPTLTDSQVLACTKEGFLMLPAAVPAAVNSSTMDFLGIYGKGRSLIAGTVSPQALPPQLLTRGIVY